MKLPFSKKGLSTHALSYGKHLQPSRDWLVLLIAWLALLIMSIAYHVWLFARVTGGDPLEPGTTVVELGIPDLGAANKVFEAREAERARYVGTYRFVDPSR